MALKNEIVNKKTHYVNRPNSVYVVKCLLTKEGPL